MAGSKRRRSLVAGGWGLVQARTSHFQVHPMNFKFDFYDFDPLFVNDFRV